MPKIELFFIKMQNKLIKVLGTKVSKIVVNICSLPYRIVRKIKNVGVKETLSLIKSKIYKK